MSEKTESTQAENTQNENTQNDIEIEPLSNEEMNTVSGGTERTREIDTICSYIGCS